MTERTERILRNIGIDPASTAPNVVELRNWIEKSGMQNMGASWGPEAGSDDNRARALLEAKWEIENGHSCRTEVMDCYPINRRFDCLTMRWHYEFRPDRIMPWLRDQGRRLAMHWRIQRDKTLGRKNPFKAVSDRTT